jgi:hypothetical protein
MKILLLSFFIFVLFYPTELHAQQGKYQWTSEWSPFNRFGHSKLFEESERNTFEWRNRIGMEMGKNVFIGLQGNLTRFRAEGLIKIIDESTFISETTYAHKHKSTFWGVGPFLTRRWILSEKITISATAFAVVESGAGNYSLAMEAFVCPVCLSFIPLPYTVYEQKIHERSISSGIDFGGSYRLSTLLSFSISANVFQFVDYRMRQNGQPFLNNAVQDIVPVLEVSGNHWLTLLNRPIIHGGLILNFEGGKKTKTPK